MRAGATLVRCALAISVASGCMLIGYDPLDVKDSVEIDGRDRPGHDEPRAGSLDGSVDASRPASVEAAPAHDGGGPATSDASPKGPADSRPGVDAGVTTNRRMVGDAGPMDPPVAADDGGPNDAVDADAGDTRAAWAESSCQRRMRLTFDNAEQAESMSSTPILVTLSSANVDYSMTEDSGADLRFRDMDGTTVLAHEVEFWDETASSYVWVSVPRIEGGSASDFIVMYFGCADTAPQDAAGVWNAHYDGVWHLGDDLSDSSGAGNHGTNNGTATVAGAIGLARDLGGLADRIEVPGTPALKAAQSVSAWARHDSLSDGENLLVACGGPDDVEDDNYQYTLDIAGDGRMYFFSEYGSAVDSEVYSTEAVSTGSSAWHHYAFVRDEVSQVVRFFVDGVQLGAAVMYDNAPSGGDTASVWFGAAQSSPLTYGFNGRVDEVRITRETLSAEWLRVQYLSMSNTYLTYGAVEVR